MFIVHILQRANQNLTINITREPHMNNEELEVLGEVAIKHFPEVYYLLTGWNACSTVMDGKNYRSRSDIRA